MAIGLQVLMGGVLALAAVVMVNWLAGRPGVRQRVDFTSTGRNSLDLATRLVLESLREPVEVDIFFRPAHQPMTAKVYEVQSRTKKLLALSEALSAGQLQVRENDLMDRLAVQERLQQLHIRGLENCLVVSQGSARAVVRLWGDLADFDLGNPDPNNFRPPSILSFNAERELVEAILKVTRGERPKVLFLTGHGEIPLMDSEEESLGKLHAALRDDGLGVETWNRLEDGEFPEDTALIAVVGPTDPLADELLDELEAFARGGGRLLIAPSGVAEELKQSGLQKLADRFGVDIGEGTVMQAWLDPTTGRMFGGPRALGFKVRYAQMRRHPILDAMRSAERTFSVFHSHPVGVARQISGGQGLSTPLVASDPNLSWLDDPYPPNYEHDTSEDARSFDLLVACQWVPEAFLDKSTASEAQAAGPKEKVEARLLVLGSADWMRNYLHDENESFLLGAFNWLVDREWRVSVSPKDPDYRVLDPEAHGPVLHLALWILPALCLLGGLLTAFRRSRGGVTHH